MAAVESKQCQEHSGMIVWIKIGCGLLGLLCSLFSYSAFFQIPSFRDEMRQALNQHDQRILKTENDIAYVRETLARVIYQRNADHPTKDNLK